MENFQDKIIYFDIEVNELYAMIDITQTYRNISNTSLEIKIKLPKTKNQLLKFTAKINEEKLFQSKVLDIEKAKEKYTDAISSGNTGLIAYQSDDDFTVINIGNLLYDDMIELTTTYYQLLSKYNNKSILDLNFSLFWINNKFFSLFSDSNIILIGIILFIFSLYDILYLPEFLSISLEYCLELKLSILTFVKL